jgi:hypothetical protein
VPRSEAQIHIVALTPATPRMDQQRPCTIICAIQD